MKAPNIVLASTSPRRKGLLTKAGIEFVVRPPFAEELLEGDPFEIVVTNAIAKARSVEGEGGDIILGSDTLVVCNGEFLGKPRDEKDAERMIRLQVQYPQTVITGICVLKVGTDKEITGFEASGVIMKGSEEDIHKHIISGQWKGKAGAYGIQDEGSLSFNVLYGEWDNIVGLPMKLVRRALSLLGYEYPENTPSQGD